MYTDEDLTLAVQHHVLKQSDVKQFQQFIEKSRNSHSVDEENFRLINGFNDIFVVISSALLLASLAWLGYAVTPPLGGIAVASGSWVLAEYFVYKRRMALPAIALLLSFLLGLFATPILFRPEVKEIAFIGSGLLTTFGAIAHWIRFRVPITVAAGAATLTAGIVATVLYLFPATLLFINHIVLGFGLLLFGLAMYWDSKDTARQTRASDVAFWLHLISAPMIVHPIFQSLGVLEGSGDMFISLVVLALYVLLALISIAVDRRAIMVSALTYVVYTFSALMEDFGMVTSSFAVTGLCIGTSLLLLSAYWHNCRRWVLKLVPHQMQLRLPEAKA